MQEQRDIQVLIFEQTGRFLGASSINIALNFCRQGWRLFAAVNFDNLKIGYIFHKEMEAAGVKVLHYQLSGDGQDPYRSLTIGLYFIKED